MNEKQQRLLKMLALVMIDIAEEAGNDDNFNDQLADLGIFNISIDEAASKIINIID